MGKTQSRQSASAAKNRERRPSLPNVHEVDNIQSGAGRERRPSLPAVGPQVLPININPAVLQQSQRQPVPPHRQSKPAPQVPQRSLILTVQRAIDAGKKVVQGLYDYMPSADQVIVDDADSDLYFKKGDYMLVIKEDGDWWYAEHMSNYEKGYIPCTYVAEMNSIRQFEWFHGKIGRKDAEKLLSGPSNQRGTFLVRESETIPGAYSLSLLAEDQTGERMVKHYRIREMNNGGCYISPRQTFTSLEELLQHYKNADGLCCNLTKACSKVKPVMYDMSHATRDRWEIDRKSIKLQEKLGEGMFGQVWKGIWNKCIPVAIKTLKEGTMEPAKFLQEAAIMKKLQHPKLVALYAVCSQQEPIYIVTELMNRGNLLKLLRDDNGRTLRWNQLIDVAAQVADGMHYLEDLKFIHRDLAARNILVSDNRTVKIGDFGLAMNFDPSASSEAEGNKIPIKWTSPEAIRNREFSTKSDVWSYGILLVELVTYGQIPYPDKTNKEVLEFVEKGHRHPQPNNCPSEMYEIMLMCWKKTAADRPTFDYLFHTMDDYNVAIASSYAET